MNQKRVSESWEIPHSHRRRQIRRIKEIFVGVAWSNCEPWKLPLAWPCRSCSVDSWVSHSWELRGLLSHQKRTNRNFVCSSCTSKIPLVVLIFYIEAWFHRQNKSRKLQSAFLLPNLTTQAALKIILSTHLFLRIVAKLKQIRDNLHILRALRRCKQIPLSF